MGMGGGGGGDVSAVTAAGDHDLVAIEVGIFLDPVQQRINVFVCVVAMEAIVELQESFAVSGRTANVGINDGNAQFVEKIIVAREESCPCLPLRTAMNVHHDRTLAGNLLRIRPVEEAGDG